MRQVSAYILALANAISDDLRGHIAPDKLQQEVERELEDQMLSKLVQVIGQYNSTRAYDKTNNVQLKSRRKEVLRYMGYCNEMWVKQEIVKGALGSGDDLTEAEEAVLV